MNWITEGDVENKEQGFLVVGDYASLIQRSNFDVLWESLCLKLTYTPNDHFLHIMLDPWYVLFDEINGRLNLSRFTTGSTCAAWDIELPAGEWSVLEIATTISTITISVNGQSYFFEASDKVPTTSVQLHFSGGAKFLEPELSIVEKRTRNETSPIVKSRKALEMTVDFWDDLQLTAFNQEMLDEMFRIMARYHVSQAYWIHHGKQGSGGIWENNTAAGNIQRTFDALGDDFLPAAVQAAHKSNIPLVGIFKPFETMCNYTFPVRAGEDGADALGGRLDNIYAFPSQHPWLCQRRRKTTLSQSSPSQIVITSRKVLPEEFGQQLQLYVSRDNAEYSQYRGKCSIEATEREIRVNDLDIQEEFVMLVFTPELAARVLNTLPLLAKAYDAKGNELEFTYGITPRRERKAEYHLEQEAQLLDFRTHGINFDCAGDGMPSANVNPEKIRFDLFSPQKSEGWLGLAFNVNAQAPGVLSEAEPEAQSWWLGKIEEMLDAGVDGVEIRMMNHTNVIDWQQYGFNQPVVDEYQKRHGVDILSQEYSRPELRRLRGDFFTEFLRKASSRVRARGKKFYLHIEDLRQGTANEPCAMETEMQWRQWLSEGLCDGVTLKVNNFWSHDTAFGRELLAICKAQSIPVSFAPFIHSASMADNSQRVLDYAMSSPFDAFNVYEFASLFAFKSDGTFAEVDKKSIDWLNSYQWQGKH